VTTDDGGSRFEDVNIALTEQPISPGVPPMFVGSMSGGASVVFLRSTEFDSEPHPAPREQWVVMLRGAIEVESSDGTRRRFEPGDFLFVADVTGRGHITRAMGQPPLEALFVQPR
jgi:hypothetical protein